MIPYIMIPLLLLPLISLIYLISIFIGKKGSPKNLLPGSYGYPIIGENMKFVLLGPQKFIKDRMEKYSPEVFKTSLLGEKMAIFCGAPGNKFLFMNENKLLTTWWPKSIKKALLFPEYINMNLKEVSALQSSFNHEILKPDALKQYIPVMDALACDHLDHHWTRNSVVKVFPLAKKYTFELACRLFLSLVDEKDIKKLSDPFGLVTNGLFSTPIDFPGTAYNRAIKGGKMVREELMRIIKNRRKEMMEKKDQTEGRDLLSKMLLLTDEDGKFLSEMQICNNIVGFLVASFETTSSAVTSVINYLAQLPHVYEEVFKEQMEIAKSKGLDEPLTWEDIEKMKYSWNVVRETLRLTPPAQGAFRETTTEFTYAGFTIPKGIKTFWTVHSSHKNPKYFPEPEKFDPSRFEGSGPAPFTFVPFGGGPRMCPGKEYARLEVLVFIHNVVRRFKLEKTIPNEKFVVHTAPIPVHGLPVHLHPHEK
ncbi:Cytochrome P450 CYP4/CYP19/CYP26 subfamily [Handroanthus impetiginosus]|uniref:Cytochrome P450 CYP4/CYP19/CYP26 subfamily n=1 Tax=Handroanthus impetiginosus TaxID=429701 RepID=A0A2G9H046_9LAMI|nr:Cytochrome P450 CYP4/CYP19/CYP26 subfamily [Handroanthus impetiginosus]